MITTFCLWHLWRQKSQCNSHDMDVLQYQMEKFVVVVIIHVEHNHVMDLFKILVLVMQKLLLLEICGILIAVPSTASSLEI